MCVSDTSAWPAPWCPAVFALLAIHRPENHYILKKSAFHRASAAAALHRPTLSHVLEIRESLQCRILFARPQNVQ
jgi:hypothetical protein